MTLKREQVETIRAMREDGQSVLRVADAVGITAKTTRKYCRLLGLDGVRCEQRHRGPVKGSVAHAALVEYGFRRFLDNMARNGHAARWEYVSGYDGSESVVALRCKECGEIVERQAQFARKTKPIRRLCCAARRRDEHDARVRHSRVVMEERRAVRNQERVAARESRKRLCVVCGEPFIPHVHGQVTCDSECRRRYKNRYQELYKRAKRQSIEVYDTSITLDCLISRDQGLCHICGEVVLVGDFVVSPEGH